MGVCKVVDARIGGGKNVAEVVWSDGHLSRYDTSENNKALQYMSKTNANISCMLAHFAVLLSRASEK